MGGADATGRRGPETMAPTESPQTRGVGQLSLRGGSIPLV